MDWARFLILLVAFSVVGCMGGSSNNESVTRFIAYTKLFPGDRAAEVWTASLDGSGAHRLVRGVRPSVSPDGRWVAFLRCGGYSIFDCDLYATRNQGGRSQLLVRKADTPVAWSPDSDGIGVGKYESDFGPTALLRIDVESGQRVVLARGDVHGWSFSPSGEEVVYGRGGERSTRHRLGAKVDLYVVGVDGEQRRRLTFDGRSGFPVWGPEVIAFSRLLLNGGWGKDEIWLIDSDGRDRRTLTGPLPKSLIGHGIGGLEPLAWSEDGESLLVGLTNEFGVQPYAVDPDTGLIRKIGDFGYQSFAAGLSRDGGFVLVAEEGFEGPGDFRISVAPFRGGRAKLIATAAGSPSWNR